MTKREAGTIIISDPGSDKPLLEVATLQCAHCGCHWVPQPGSGIARGFCTGCNDYICGPDCAGKCIPVEQMLENIEQGRPLDFKPIRGNVAAVPWQK